MLQSASYSASLAKTVCTVVELKWEGADTVVLGGSDALLYLGHKLMS